MKKSCKRLLLSALLLTGATLPPLTYATNGYFLIGFGTKSRGMGGVGVAYAQDGMAAAYNPASMVDVKDRMDMGGDLFYPRRSAFLDSPATLPIDHKSSDSVFLIPHMGMAMKVTRKITVGMAVIGAGLGTKYFQGEAACKKDPAARLKDDVVNNFFNFNCNGGNDKVGVELMQMQILPSVAYKVSRNHAVGVTFVIATQVFVARGLKAFEILNFTETPGKISDNGTDWSFGGGLRVGWLGKFFKKRLTLGLNYSSRVYMTEFERYAGLFAEQGDFDIPENYAFGMAFRVTKKLTTVFDVQRIRYNEIASIGNPGPRDDSFADLFPTPRIDPADGSRAHLLGKDDGLGFGWTNQTIFKLGVHYKHNRKWTFRGGLNYGKSPIPDDQLLFNTLAPGVVEKHVTVGTSYRPSKVIEWSFSWVHAFEHTQVGTTRFSGRPVGEDNAAISMYQDSFGASFGMRF